MNAHVNVPAHQISLDQVVQEYNAKVNGGKVEKNGTVIAEYPGIDAIIERYKALHTELKMASTIGGCYVGPVVKYHPSLDRRDMASSLLESAWRHVYKGLCIDKIATASDRSKFELSLKNPPEFTLENIGATFGDYIQQPREHMLRGVAEVFSGLDPAYKSHSKVKIGVEGLPKRIILSGCGEYNYGSYGQAQIRDILNALASLEGREHVHDGDVSNMVREARSNGGEVTWQGGRLKVFGNGNGHLFFNRDMLTTINKALAEYYGDVLPDTPQAAPQKSTSTAVSKDLQFYPTPTKVVETVLGECLPSMKNDGEGMKVLEPSCGDGQILKTFRARFPRAELTGVEVDPSRVQACQMAGFKVLRANFLQVRPNPVYDVVIMNPPFYGTHWKKHLEHALKFLKPRENTGEWGDRFTGGKLISILPATAFYDGHLEDMGLVRKGSCKEKYGWRDTGWHDLPVGSFAESGTRVPTGYFVTKGEIY